MHPVVVSLLAQLYWRRRVTWHGRLAVLHKRFEFAIEAHKYGKASLSRLERGTDYKMSPAFPASGQTLLPIAFNIGPARPWQPVQHSSRCMGHCFDQAARPASSTSKSKRAGDTHNDTQEAQKEN